MKTQHTPGPWAVGVLYVSKEFQAKSICEGFSVGNMLGKDVGHPEADARLIAAAPELLFIAEWTEKFLSGKFHDADVDGMKEKINQIINKARGES